MTPTSDHGPAGPAAYRCARAVVRLVLAVLACAVPGSAAPVGGSAPQLPGSTLGPRTPDCSAPAVAQTRGSGPELPEAPDSPRASLRAFLDFTRRGDERAATRYLALGSDHGARGPELARRLRAVLDRYLDVPLDAVSPLAEGDARDELPPGVDSIGQVPHGATGHDSVFLVRARDASGPFWQFSEQTVSRIDGWYDTLPDRWARDWMPAALQRLGPADLMWWQWLAVPALLLLAFLGGRLLGTATNRLLRRLARRTETPWDDRLLARVSPALTLLWSVAVAALLLRRLALLPEAHATARAILGGFATFAAFWALWRSVDVGAQFLLERPGAADSSSTRSLVSVARSVVRALLAVTGLLTTLAVFGYPVTTVLAGLGIGGIAVAFGAQKTIENLFGSIAIAADRPLRVGHFVRVEDFSGTVERIGMRSTRFRTLDRTLVSVPNGKLADLQIEDFAPRDRIRFATTVGLDCGTTAEQVRRIVLAVEGLLRAAPKVRPDVVVARLAALGPSSLDVEVLCWFETTDYEEFRRLRQDVLLEIMRIVEQTGAAFASPARALPPFTPSRTQP
jgi:MscS family membrane protein